MDGDPLAQYALGTLGDAVVPGLPRFFDQPALKPQVRIATRNMGYLNPREIGHYLAAGGYQGFQKALGMTPDAGDRRGDRLRPARPRRRGLSHWDEVEVRAPGGRQPEISDLQRPTRAIRARLWTARCWRAIRTPCLRACSSPPTPSARAKASSTCARSTHWRSSSSNAPSARCASATCSARGYSGTDFRFDIEIKEGAGAFVCGRGDRAHRLHRRQARHAAAAAAPFPANAGLWGKPTNINNVETFANLPPILTNGAAWYAGFGGGKNTGTKTFSLTGKVKWSGLIEVPAGHHAGPGDQRDRRRHHRQPQV